MNKYIDSWNEIQSLSRFVSSCKDPLSKDANAKFESIFLLAAHNETLESDAIVLLSDIFKKKYKDVRFWNNTFSWVSRSSNSGVAAGAFAKSIISNSISNPLLLNKSPIKFYLSILIWRFYNSFVFQRIPYSTHVQIECADMFYCINEEYNCAQSLNFLYDGLAFMDESLYDTTCITLINHEGIFTKLAESSNSSLSKAANYFLTAINRFNKI